MQNKRDLILARRHARVATLLGAALLVTAAAARAVPSDNGRKSEIAGRQFAQGFQRGGQFGGGQFGGGQIGGGNFGTSQFGGNRGGFPGGSQGGGRQGGAFPGGGNFSLAPGQAVLVAAACTDLPSDPPDATTRFRGGGKSVVVLANGEIPLDKALDAGLVSIGGKNDSFMPFGRGGSLLLNLQLVNRSGQPLRVSIARGDTVTPAGQASQPLPEGSDLLFQEAAQQRISLTNTTQFAVWGARGSTAEEVEQANMARLKEADIQRAQALLDAAGIKRIFDRDRGTIATRYEKEAEKLGSEVQDVAGYTYLADGKRAKVSGVRSEDGRGVVTVTPAQGGDYYYSARFTARGGGKASVQLFQLATEHPVRVNRGSLLLYQRGA